jgi:hypothetical protein
MRKRQSCFPALLVVLLLLTACRTTLTEATPSDATVPDMSSDAVVIGVNHTRAESPNGMYLAESYGVNDSVTSGGLYPAEGIRLIETATDTVLWQMPGYYDTAFLWSGESRYLAVFNMARTEGQTVIVDTEDFSDIPVSAPQEILDKMREYRADPYLKAVEWLDSSRVLISVQWVGKDEQTYIGTFEFMPASGQIQNISVSALPAG